MTRPRVLVVGAGFAGFHYARELERLLRPSEAELTLASPVDYMLYSPLLPQVAAGVITPQAAAVSLRRTLRRTLRAPCSITGVDLGARTCVAQAVTGEVHTVPWDYLVLCPGAVTTTFGTPGGEQYGRGMKTLAQATHLHDHVLAELELGNAVADERHRAAHCTFVVAGAGYAGVETAAALHLLTRRLLPRFINLRPEHLRWVLADAAPHVLPELGEKLSAAVLGRLRQRGIDVRLGTGIAEITASAVRLSDGAELPCHTMVWTAGVMASPLIGTLGLETARSGRLRVTPELQVPGRADVFSAGDAAAVPDLARGADAITPPTAQHAQRQGITIARNIARRLRGQPLRPYQHRDLGLAVDLGGTQAVASPLGRHLTGVPAQLATRGYHLYALPSPEDLKPGEYRMAQADIDRGQEFRKCIECWLCQDVCHVIRDHEDNKPAYAGPRYFVRHAELDMHPLDSRDRREALRDRQGLGLCNITKCCTEVCPAGIKITDNAIIPMKERSAGQRYDPLGRILRSWRRREAVSRQAEQTR